MISKLKKKVSLVATDIGGGDIAFLAQFAGNVLAGGGNAFVARH